MNSKNNCFSSVIMFWQGIFIIRKDYYMKKISILGSTGSIGKQTLDVVRDNRDKF